MDSVALVKCENNIQNSLREGLKLIGGFGNLKKLVLIKPNICTISDDTGYSVTRIDIIEAIIELLFEIDKELSVKIVESNSQSKNTMEAFERFGYRALADRMTEKGYDVSLLDLSVPPLMSIQYTSPDSDTLEISTTLYKPEKYFISVAVSKTHPTTFITGALKNQFGLIARKDQARYHPRIDNVIVDLNQFVKPDLCIVDARVGVEGWNGPKTRELDVLIIGRQPVSVDATMTRMMGFEPEQVSHLMKAADYELGTLNPEILGESIESIKVEFNKAK